MTLIFIWSLSLLRRREVLGSVAGQSELGLSESDGGPYAHATTFHLEKETTVGATKTPRILGPQDGDILGDPETVLDRFMIAGEEVGGRFTMVEHRLAPYALAAPLHLHTREDEFSFIIEGQVGVHIDGSEHIVRQGDLVSKPRDQWHTFWNAGDTPARILEIISPGGLEKLFRLLDTSPELYEPASLAPLADEYGAKVDFEGTMPIVERYGLNF